MSDRITRRHLDQACRVLNGRAGFADQALWQRVCAPGCAVGKSVLAKDVRHTTGCRNVATVGMFCVDGAYGGWALEQVLSEGGGVRDVFRCGHVPARELYYRMQAYLTALEDQEEAKR